MNNKNIILAVVAILIIGAVIFLESKKIDQRGNAPEIIAESEITKETNKDTSMSRSEILASKEKQFERAKEISTPDGFINIDEINITDLIGKKVVLLDIWTYSCINCQRTLPFLNQWHEKYEDEGLVIIGLHTPEFEFEKVYDNVKKATEKYGVKYPVVLDNDYSTWTAYKNRYWPRKYLIDIDGFIVYDHIGEGGYEETEAKIVELLNERRELLGMTGNVELSLSRPEGVVEVKGSQVKTPEIYLGWERAQYIANFPPKDCIDSVCDYVLPEGLAPNTYVLGGKWTIGPESAVLEEEEGVIRLAFNANTVNLVVVASSGASAEIWLDGEKIKDIQFDEADLYNLVDLKGEYGQHLLEIKIKGKGFSAFAFTFG